MHKALYRKWRPQSFGDVCGQEHITTVLSHQVAADKLSHAYLFCGSRGTGKTTCAKILAKAVNCLSPVDGSPCGKCEACLGIDSGTLTDVTEMDAASNNGVDDVRLIRDDVVYSPSALRYRVYIIDEVHMLSVSAFNALLKTLEEPPAHVIFILATTELQKLPATIVSRCQRFDFRRIPTSVIADRLAHIAREEGIEAEDGALSAIASLAQGGMRDAISMLELCAGESLGSGHPHITAETVRAAAGSAGRQTLLDTVDAVLRGDIERIFETVQSLYDSSCDIGVFWQDLMSLYRDMTVIKASSHAERYIDITKDEFEATRAVAARMDKERVAFHLQILDGALADMQRGGIPRRLCAELALIRMSDPRYSDAGINAALSSRLAALEDRLAALESGGVALPNTAPAAVPERGGEANVGSVGNAEDGKDSDIRGSRGIEKTGGAEPREPITDRPSAAEAESADTGADGSEGKRVLRRVGYISELIEDFSRVDPSAAGFLRLCTAYRTEDVLLIRTSDDFVRSMLEGGGTVTSLLAAAKKYDGDVARVGFETVEAREGEHLLIDEIVE